ncbi:MULTISPECIES: hypothetical protein [unclassified Microcoleus]|jgi:hypothetical protein|uniref:hypothetical protein n=1 Tax=unclassified Microcoleus TaxID=2642155 RepID=UPI001DFF2505|nr:MULTISPECIES: hypothetical protein [unclassified Microcoleus]MCC3443910.1 hypothetical protein [Microcoleus sp. PH2017_03_ELD_O_A]MCC3468304.1 hypothetical protein [Microcoleus sp. PH2017_06_SFM_O_A]MCC3412253.1 hypothetical protein [Microcoleus sp. PH2017_02_FOX_O_A]MCC3435440.1 hypothetical protein [Microcoleus sp. PH2017_05_CCC_O_A]MCC3448697.1 hypothetical protein [Microcoleus sp. PH2017_09_SFU_O_A]
MTDIMSGELQKMLVVRNGSPRIFMRTRIPHYKPILGRSFQRTYSLSQKDEV